MNLFRRKKFESDMDAELGFHLDAYIDDLVRSGMDRAEAARRARIEFGATEATKDECRQAWGLQHMDELRADLRLAFRTLRRNPGFAAVAILSVALGIGANTAIFGLMDAVMLRILPVRDPGRLVFVRTAGTAGRDGPPYPYFELLRDQSQSYEAVAAFSASNMELVIDRGREQTRGVWVSGNFYGTLGIAPLLGRTLTRPPVASSSALPPPCCSAGSYAHYSMESGRLISLPSAGPFWYCWGSRRSRASCRPGGQAGSTPCLH